MTQQQLNREVARATGESVETIQRLGFYLEGVDIDSADRDGMDQGPQVLDWDALDEVRASGMGFGHAPA